MVGARLLDRFGLGLFDEFRVAEPPFERFRFLATGGQRLFEPGLFGVDIDQSFERDDIGIAARRDLHRCAGGGSAAMHGGEARHAF